MLRCASYVVVSSFVLRWYYRFFSLTISTTCPVFGEHYTRVVAPAVDATVGLLSRLGQGLGEQHIATVRLGFCCLVSRRQFIVVVVRVHGQRDPLLLQVVETGTA